MREICSIRASTTCMAIIEEGRAQEARTIVLRQGTRRFGAPSAKARTLIETITDLDRLEVLTDRLLDVENWDELLAG